jgi:hypothetical protein
MFFVSRQGQNRDMAAKMDSKIAVAIMNKAGFNPLVPYPGIKKPWLSRHTECNQNVSPT